MCGNVKFVKKTAKHKGHLKNHAETHIEGMSHICHICSRTYPNRLGVQMHISNVHTELVSCEVCGKTGMNRRAYRDHKRSNHTAVTQ